MDPTHPPPRPDRTPSRRAPLHRRRPPLHGREPRIRPGARGLEVLASRPDRRRSPAVRLAQLLRGRHLHRLGGLLLAREFNLIWFRLSMLFPLIFVLVGLNIVSEHLRRRSAKRRRAARRAGPSASGPSSAAASAASSRRSSGADRRTPCSAASRSTCARRRWRATRQRSTSSASAAAARSAFPESWNVSMKAIAIFGGQDDKTRPPAPGSAHKELLVTGFILFGGLGIKN